MLNITYKFLKAFQNFSETTAERWLLKIERKLDAKDKKRGD